MPQMGKLLIVIGVVLVVVGVFMYLIPFGRLPGDIIIKKEKFVLYFPLMTSLLVSAVLSLIFFLISKLGK